MLDTHHQSLSHGFGILDIVAIKTLKFDVYGWHLHQQKSMTLNAH
jgi:hypothetical protein